MIRHILIGICLINNVGDVVSTGSFWQISDLHLEKNYSIHGDTTDMCRGDKPNVTLSPYGNFKCDSPWKLITEAILAMKHIEPAPDFILWTGDVMAHLSDSVISWTDIYSALNQTTNLLIKSFPNTSVIAVVGNHDVHPANEIPDVGFSSVYKKYLSDGGWNKLVPQNQTKYFINGGYYAVDVKPQLRVIVLNTNIYLSHNKAKPTDPDPASQFSWLKDQLEIAKTKQIKIIITAHAPPGYFERNPVEPFLASPYNEEYIKILINYSDIILTQIYGHTHTDSFRLFMDSDGAARTHAFIAPSVSPKILQATNGVNPSIRLYEYDLYSGFVKDYQQYFLNLSQLFPTEKTQTYDFNFSNKDATNRPTWELLYTANSAYGVHNLHLKSLSIIYEDISSNEEIFERYYLYNSVGIKDKPCDEKCRTIQICAITQLTSNNMKQCMTSSSSRRPKHDGNDPDRHHRHPITPKMKYVIIGIALGLFIALVIMAVVASAFCVRRRFTSGFRYQKHVSYNTT